MSLSTSIGLPIAKGSGGQFMLGKGLFPPPAPPLAPPEPPPPAPVELALTLIVTELDCMCLPSTTADAPPMVNLPVFTGCNTKERDLYWLMLPFTMLIPLDWIGPCTTWKPGNS